MRFPQVTGTAMGKASTFTSEPDAWYAAYEAGLNPDHCRVMTRTLATDEHGLNTDKAELGTINQTKL
jgi:hypothetical protein